MFSVRWLSRQESLSVLSVVFKPYRNHRFTAPGPSETVRNFVRDYNNHEWNRVARYASANSCHYMEKQRDMALAGMKLVTSLTGLIHGALPDILNNALGVMGYPSTGWKR